jgi:predicted XRE-type DNA-binding protein
MANNDTARKAIKVWLASHDKNQRWLADALGLTEPRMSDLMSGRLQPSDEIIDHLKVLTGIDLRAFESVA